MVHVPNEASHYAVHCNDSDSYLSCALILAPAMPSSMENTTSSYLALDNFQWMDRWMVHVPSETSHYAVHCNDSDSYLSCALILAPAMPSCCFA